MDYDKYYDDDASMIYDAVDGNDDGDDGDDDDDDDDDDNDDGDDDDINHDEIFLGKKQYDNVVCI